MPATVQPPIDLHGASAVRELVEGVFRFDTEHALSVKIAMAYQFAPERRFFTHRGLTFEAILNRSRYDYVKDSLGKLAQAGRSEEQETLTWASVQGNGPGRAQRKRSLLPHMPPPGTASCPLDDLERNPRHIAWLSCNAKDYGLVVNGRPWGYQHTMLVTRDREPQALGTEELLASLLLLCHLGADFEGIFTGVLAGASVYHFHLQVHRGASVLWRNIEEGNVQLRPFFAREGVRGYTAVGWPAELFLFEAPDCYALARPVSGMIELLARGDNDYPYNIGFRRQDNLLRLVLFPRSGVAEKPEGVNPYPDSWGRFSFLEMGGGIYLLTPEGYEATVKSPEGLYNAIAQMSIQRAELARLIHDFLDRESAGRGDGDMVWV